MPITGESFGYLNGYQFGGDYWTPGFTASTEVLSAQSTITVHTMLSYVAAAEAIMGIASTTGFGGPVSYGNPETWLPVMYLVDVTSVIVGFTVSRGAAQGLWTVHYW